MHKTNIFILNFAKKVLKTLDLKFTLSDNIKKSSTIVPLVPLGPGPFGTFFGKRTVPNEKKERIDKKWKNQKYILQRKLHQKV